MKAFFKKAAVVFLSIAMTAGFSINTYAAKAPGDDVAIPYYVAVITTYTNINLESLGKMVCEGSTTVRGGYKAGVKVELQQLNGSWGTIKSWYASDADYAFVGEGWYVEKGYDYRVKTTHYSYNSSGTQLESIPKYSRTIHY